MPDRESSAVTDFISAVRRPITEGGSGAHPRLVRRTPPRGTIPLAEPAAQGTPGPQWSPPLRARARGTLPPPIPSDARRVAPPRMPTAPPALPRSASASSLPPLPRPALGSSLPPASSAPPPVPRDARRPGNPPPIPTAAPAAARAPRPQHPDLAADTVPSPRIEQAALEMCWYDEDAEPTEIAPAVEARAALRARSVDATEIAVIPRRTRWPIILGLAGGLLGSAAIAGYIATSGNQVTASSATSPALLSEDTAEPAAPAATPVPPAAPVAEPRPAVQPAVSSTGPAISFISEPAGATVTLIEDGQPRVIGETPLEAVIDPDRHYEVMFALAGHATTLQPLEAAGTPRIEVTLQAAGARVAPLEPGADQPEPSAPVERAAGAERETVSDKSPPRRRARRAARAERKPERKARRTAAATPDRAHGLLALGAKPPCDIYIDGKNTGLQTPQRSIELPAGKHRVTLINRDHRIKKSFSVRIQAGKRIRAIQDLTDRID